MTAGFERGETTPTLDRELFDSLRVDLGDEPMSQLVTRFSERAPQMRELGHATRRGDGPAVVQLAHSLRGAAGIFGAKKLAELARRLEERGLGELEEGSDALADEATIEFERAVSEMRAQLAVPAQEPPAGESGASGLSPAE
ncbi:MAG TPA: Hpt domain-containing protein [Solirubrobacterales bacterium]